MATTKAATTHDQQKSPTPTQQMPQGQTYGQRQPEHGSESSPPLHRYLGNSYVQAMTTKKQRLGLQTKLTVNEPGDIYEQEADRVADQVMAAPTHANISSAPLQIQRFSESSHGQGDAAPASVAQTLASPGRPLEPALRQDMEQRFGHDFSSGARAYRRGCRTIGAGCQRACLHDGSPHCVWCGSVRTGDNGGTTANCS